MKHRRKVRFGPSIVPAVLPVLLFGALLALFVTGVARAGGAQQTEALRSAENAVKRAMVACYALEGYYPESYTYLRDHYGLRIDETAFTVHYEVFASNIMPTVTVTKR